MIINAIQLWSAVESSGTDVSFAELSLDKADLTESYIVEKILGLDADTIIPKFYGNYSDDEFYEMSMPPRDVNLKIQLNPQYSEGETPSSLRDALYRAISYSRTGLVHLRLMLGAVQVAYIQGFIKKLESDIFTANPNVEMIVECGFPFLRSPTYTDIAGDPGVTPPNPTLIDSLSTAPHGFVMELQFTATVATSFTIQGKSGTVEWPFKILRPDGDPFVSGDRLYLSSERDNKYLYMVPNGSDPGEGDDVLLVDSIDINPIWPIIFPGENQLGFSTSNVLINSLTFKHHYWGV